MDYDFIVDCTNLFGNSSETDQRNTRKSTYIPAQTEYKLQSIEFKVMNSQEKMN
jgi:hypothetical protein